MRVTNKLIADSLNRNIQSNLSRLARTQEQLSTGKEIIRPSDKPGNLGPLLSVKSALSYFEQYNRNLEDGLSYLYLNDSTMQTVGDILHQSAELAIQGASGTYTASDMAALGEQIDKMIDHMVDLANSSVGGRYIYAGSKNSRPPFERMGDTITYNGDFNGLYREVLSGDNYRIDAPGISRGWYVTPLGVTSTVEPVVVSRPSDLNITGMFTIQLPETFSRQTTLDGTTPATLIGGSPPVSGVDYDMPAPGHIRVLTGDLAGLEIDFTGCASDDTYRVVIDNKQGVYGHGEETAPGVFRVYDPVTPKSDTVDEGIFDVMFRLRDRLRAGDKAGTDASTGELRAATDQLLQWRVGTGSRTRHFEALKDQMIDLETKLTEVQTKLESADVYKLSINMSQDQVTLQASLAAGANILRLSLLDFLK